MAYVGLMQLLNNNQTATGPRWENSTGSNYFNYVDSKDKRLHQMWYDDPVSSRLKYRAAAVLGIAGVGPYEFSDLDYSNDTLAIAQTRAMWGALREFLL